MLVLAQLGRDQPAMLEFAGVRDASVFPETTWVYREGGAGMTYLRFCPRRPPGKARGDAPPDAKG